MVESQFSLTGRSPLAGRVGRRGGRRDTFTLALGRLARTLARTLEVLSLAGPLASRFSPASLRKGNDAHRPVKVLPWLSQCAGLMTSIVRVA